MNTFKNLIMITGLIFVSFSQASICEVDLDLKSFKEDPKAFLNAPVQKRDGNCGDKIFSYFNGDEVTSKEYVKIKDEQRANLCHTDSISGQKVCLKDIEPGSDIEVGRAAIQGIDRAENLISGNKIVKNVFAMEDAGLTDGSLNIKPWSDWYWPIYAGQLSFRYSDENMMKSFYGSGKDGEEMWSFMIDWHAKPENSPLILDVNLLSPAEKYDILVGDNNFTLTQYMLNKPKGFSKSGRVAAWMGICHGWAPASYMLPRATKEITVTAADGVTDITFIPSDLKALGSQLWATGSQTTKFIGGRCNIENPQTDGNGRIKDQSCFDNNPGTWHTTIVNQLGINKKSFVMDATYDVQVWNHPVTAYSYTYFNPETMEEYKNIGKAVIAMKKFKTDKFKRYRSRNAVSVVGVKMEVQYLVETEPSTSSTDNSDNDAHNMAYYVYDLELNSRYEIIGGEWYTNAHPDFLWTPYDDSHAQSSVEGYITNKVDIKNIGSINRLSQLARHASKSGQPIGKIVEALISSAAAGPQTKIKRLDE